MINLLYIFYDSEGDKMILDVFNSLFLITCFSIELFTSIILGLSLVEIKVSKIIKRSLLISILLGFMYSILANRIGSKYILLLIYFIAIFFIFYYLKVNFLQAITGVLLAVLFNLIIIQLFQYNAFDLLLRKSGMQDDVFMKFISMLFVSLNNILVTMAVISKRPVMFKGSIFEKQIIKDINKSDMKIDIFFIISILFILDSWFYFIYRELNYFRFNFRILIMFWSIMICGSLLYFLRKSIIYKNELLDFFYDRQHQEDILSYYSVIRSQRHDFNFHLNALYNLIRNENYESSKEYIEDVVKQARDINDILPIYHPATGAMLNTFKELAIQKGVEINYYIMDDLKRAPCTVYEINKILGNLIQNAIDEVEDKDNNVIDVEIFTERGQTIILKTTNNTDIKENDIKNVFDLNFSTKNSHEGIGLPTVKSILSKYNGTIYTELEDDNISFIVRIPIS